VIIRRQGEVELGEIVIPPGKALTIRAASGWAPVFVSKSWRTTNVESNAPLCLEGLEFRHPFSVDPANAEPILRCHRAPIFLANCRFLRTTREGHLRASRRNPRPLVDFIDCPKVDITNCEFYTIIGTDITLNVSDSGSDSQVRLTNNLIVGQFGLRLTAASNSRHDWQLEQNTIAGAHAMFVSSQDRQFARVNINQHHNLFDFINCFLGLYPVLATSPHHVTR
jgi:hypothetical protein